MVLLYAWPCSTTSAEANWNEPFLFRQIGVSLRDHLCGVALFIPCGYYASERSLDSLDLTKNKAVQNTLKNPSKR
jgi:hypothetical protein